MDQWMDGQTDRRTESRTDRQTDRQTGRQTDRQTDRWRQPQSIVDALATMAWWHRMGALDEGEFSAAKRQLLG